ncbi:NtaA/DmoA family FMN-dependent monooxygenase [Pseudonocardia sp. WMMC193]|uniref:NtaA/DmoA family FMN-dependent monooxygenase n=1 Tax=Pseudonocardia sp. WMMC193 TaxID=2911965 RepID=UPI001EEDD868|nr:NtaA/DmoA family FMN-dependent monooxygenase [Pseudonocardia sp. WMMC193]MCF7548395.1 NtaA/DmoA family FMN-dependent monooxygenase [Pseudonocardia sp. WMMC193]
MTADMFHLGWFGSFIPTTWQTGWDGTDAARWMDGSFYVDKVRTLERACFDLILFEDSSMVSDIYGGSAEATLKRGGWAPKGDPMALAPILARATERIGISITASTSFYPPWMLARSMATLDHMSRGRIGWNIVTSSEDLAAKNFGMDTLPPHDERYARADEFVDLVTQLWDSWDADALVMDRERGVYVDHTKVRPIDFVGKYYKSRGPLNTLRPPQGRPVLTQAGGSPAGRQFASRYADLVMALPKGVEAMKEYRADIRARAAAEGRDPDSVKVMFVVCPTLGETHQHALDRAARKDAAVRAHPEGQLIGWSGSMEIDFSQFDLDQPLPDDVQTNGHQSTLANFRKWANGRTLREACVAYRTESVELLGTPDEVAAQMDEVMQEVGGDGFLIWNQPHNRRYIGEIADGLVPALQRRGLMRTGYGHEHFRDNLLEF